MENDIAPRDNNSLLAAFARSPERVSEGAMVAMAAPTPIERVIGAQQVAVYRDEQKVLEKIKFLAAAAGSDWMYRFPVKTKDGGTDFVEGASIKLANDLARLYGNCEIDTRVMDLGDSWLIYARFTDFESGFSMTRPFQQRKSQRGMRAQNDRALDIAFQIGTSKAIRNVVVNSLQTFADFAFEEARNALVQKIGKNIEGWRERTVQGLANKKIELVRVERVMGRAAAQWTAPDIARVVAMMQSIADGMTTADEAFPPLEQQESQPARSPEAQPAVGDQGTGTPDAASGLSAAGAPAAGAPGAPSDTEVAAYARGIEAKAKGHVRKALPGEYRNDGPAAEAWFRGYDGEPL
jgi:hypothetical protein